MDSIQLAVFALIAFAFTLVALGIQLPMHALFRLLENNSREAASLMAFGLLLGFLAGLGGK
ncbi:hypothetical protein [Deinococcus aquaedulcis]|uniref:hypothetical protein n=1 Tax=Deinococcus aquaedulcis TaxID=2840455 RepID=UPI001C83373B|nr:hypothetical protein [Deinococcus aquaedulcis]